MSKDVVNAVAASTAHGISRAAGSKSVPLKVMWVLLFLIFLALFLKDGYSRVAKLQATRLIRTNNIESIPFVFPDMYFCPINPYSGSYPYVLSELEANMINKAMLEIGQKIRNFTSGKDMNVIPKMRLTQASLPFRIIANYLLQKASQSVQSAWVYEYKEGEILDVTAFYHPGNRVCFKVDLKPDQKRKMLTMENYIEIQLTTDPYFPDLNFTGKPINDLTDDDGSNPLPFHQWHHTFSRNLLKRSGYTMLVVSPGTYPSLAYERNFNLAPGFAYEVKLKMVQNTCSEDLHGTYCIANPPSVGFKNPWSGKFERFYYSSAVCKMQRRAGDAAEILGCYPYDQPILWKYNSTPGCNNVYEWTPEIFSTLVSNNSQYTERIHSADNCANKIPCTYQQFSATSSSDKWPSIGRSAAEYYANELKDDGAPGLAKLKMIAQHLLKGNHSAHLEGIFRSYVSESMLKVRISVASALSSQVVTAWSYSVTDFLSEIGGLLGLYIGCSMLTVFELLELLYIIVKQFSERRSRQPRDTTGEAVGADEPMTKEAADEEQKV